MPKVSPKHTVEVLVLGVDTPLQVGVYKRKILIDRYQSNRQISESLPKMMQAILNRYKIEGLYYARGPGRLMAIKIAYVTLQTIAIALGIRLQGANAFVFNGNRPLRAAGRLSFVLKDQGIVTTDAPVQPPAAVVLPEQLEPSVFDEKVEPLYALPPI